MRFPEPQFGGWHMLISPHIVHYESSSYSRVLWFCVCVLRNSSTWGELGVDVFVHRL
jgi:hypothetical protein